MATRPLLPIREVFVEARRKENRKKSDVKGTSPQTATPVVDGSALFT